MIKNQQTIDNKQWRNTTSTLFRQLENYEYENRMLIEQIKAVRKQIKLLELENSELKEQKEGMRLVACVMQCMLLNYQNNCIVCEIPQALRK